MKIFLTGGTGFNGSYVVDKLKDENELLVLTRNQDYKPNYENVSALYGNLSEPSKLEKKLSDFSPDAAIHLAWEGIPYDYGQEMSERNFQRTMNIMDSLRNVGCPKIVGIGTGWEYGREQGELNEGMEPLPTKPLAIVKNNIYETMMERSKSDGFDFIWTRLFYVYGPGRKESTLMPSISNSLYKGDKPEIKTPNNSFDFVYVEDVANAISKLATNKVPSGAYNIGSGESTPVKRIVEIIYEQHDKKFNKKDFERQDSPTINFWADISKIKQVINWKPEINIEDGISRTI